MSEQFTISTVPLPNPCGRPSRYPYRQLAVGESFFVANVVNLNTRSWAKTTGSTFTMRRVTENNEWGIRVFRTH
jgi:hypothetical protein